MEVSRRLVHCPLHSETQSHQREGRELEGKCGNIKEISISCFKNSSLVEKTLITNVSVPIQVPSSGQKKER